MTYCTARGQRHKLPEPLDLSNRLVDVWWIDAAAELANLDRYLTYVTDEEIQRTRRFHYQRDEHRSIVSRATLRFLLSSYLGVAPREIELVDGEFGKPALEGSPVEFNTSHSGGLIVHAIALGNAVGTDIETIRASIVTPDLQCLVLAPEEEAAIQACPRTEAASHFFAVWTRKEAYLKAIGVGLHNGLHEICVMADPTDPPRLIYDCVNPAESKAEWCFHALNIRPGMAGCVVYRGTRRLLRMRNLAH